MTISLTPTRPAIPAAAGPGYGFTAHSIFASNPAHQYDITAQILHPSSGIVVCELVNSSYTPGTNWDFIFGAKRTAFETVDVAAGSGSFGDTVDIRVQVDDFQLAAVADGPTTFSGFLYDPVGQQYVCTAANFSSGSSGGFNQGDRDQLTAIHNATVRGAYSSTTTHVGLTDNGSLNTLNLTRALRVTVTTFPPDVSRDTGTPEYFFNLGFFTMNVAQGWVKSQRLVFEFQMYEAPQALDSFGWTLRPGVTINVEELAPA